MKKYRIVIRAFTNRRDVAPMEVLKRLLERRGCEVMLANTRNFHIMVKYWKPDAVIVNTLSDIMVKEQCPDAKVIFYSGEGFHGPNDSHAKIWLEKPEYFNNMDMGLVWGEKVKDECKESFTPETALKDADLSKIHVVGNPKLDLIKFMPPALKADKKNSVGFVCRFPKLNDHMGRPTTRFLQTQFQVDETIVQSKSAHAMIRILDGILKKTDLDVSIRPHPHEQVESYHENLKYWFDKKHLGRVTIDESLFMPTWIAQHKAILSPTSTSFLEAYLLGVPVINIDFISDIVQFNQDYVSFTKEWQDAATMPESIDELIAMLGDDAALSVQPDAAIERQLTEYSDKDENQSACLNSVNYIMDLLDSDPLPARAHVPTFIVDMWDAISFRRNMRRNKYHHNFCYRKGFHLIPEYIEDILDLIEKTESAASTDQKPSKKAA
jgi:surface carbohydrate biosynthesis protein